MNRIGKKTVGCTHNRKSINGAVATLSVTALVMENPVEVNGMFENIDDTEYDVLTLAKTSLIFLPLSCWNGLI